MTRAEHELFLHAARVRTMRDTVTERTVSPLLARLPLEAPDPDRQAVADHVADTRQVLLRRRAEADPVLVRLETWRARMARGARTEPEAVLPDRVLRAISRSGARELADLAAVPGLGSIRAERFAADLLAILAVEPVGSATTSDLSERRGARRTS